MIRIIAAITKHHVIGRNNTIPWNYPGDLRFFKEKTGEGSMVIMGRNTWESIGCKSLPNRVNVIITHRPFGYINEYTGWRPSLHGFLGSLPPILKQEGQIWIIGGAQVYQEGIQYADEMILTLVPDDIPVDGSVLFPMFDTREWSMVCEQHPYEPDLKVLTYRKIKS